MVGVEIHLLIGGNAVQATDTVVVFCHYKFLTFITKSGDRLYSVVKERPAMVRLVTARYRTQYSVWFCIRP